MGECACPAAPYWRERIPACSDENLLKDLIFAWNGRCGPPFDESHHDYAHLRAITLREARKRGLDTSAARLGT